MSKRNGGPRRRSHEPRATAPLQLDAVWVAGPRTEAWDELWRRLLAVALDDGDCEEETCDGNPGDGAPAVEGL